MEEEIIMGDMLFEVPRNKTRLEMAKEQHGIETRNCNLKAGKNLGSPSAVPKLWRHFLVTA